MNAQAFLDRLDGVRPRGARKWSARCPAHQDKGPSLSIGERGDRLLVHCFAGCTPHAIVGAMGLSMHDLFMDTPLSQRQRPSLAPQNIDLIGVAFRFDIAALDRRLRSEQVLIAVAPFTGESLDDKQRDRLMNAVAKAYHDIERAELLETIADGFREKAYEERTTRHAA